MKGEIEMNEVLNAKTMTCCDCGKEFIISPAEQKFYMKKGWELPKRCYECRKEKNVMETLICVDCGKEFHINKAKKSFFEKNGLYMPKRCDECLKYKRERNKMLEG